MCSSSKSVPVIIALGDFASGVVSWAFRLREAMSEHPRYRVVLVNCYKTGNKIGEFDEEATSVSEMSALLKKYTRGLVVPNFVWDIFPVCASLMADGRPYKTIGFCRADSDEEYYDPLTWYAPAITRFAAVSPECAAVLKKRLPERSDHVFIMPTGVLVPDTLKRRWQTRPLRLIYGGRIVQEQKRVLDLIPLVTHLHQCSIPCRLTVAGAGRQLDELKAGLAAIGGGSDFVHFTGRVAPEKMPLLWADHDIFIQTSEYEGTSNSMLEAMAQGAVPVVTRTESGVAGIIKHGENGFLVEIGDMRAMAETIAALSNQEALAAMGSAAHESVRPYSIERYAEKFTAMLDSAWNDEQLEVSPAVSRRAHRSFEGIALRQDLHDHVFKSTDTPPSSQATLMITFPSHLRGGAEDYTVAIARGAVSAGWRVLAGFTRRKETDTLRRDFRDLGAAAHTLEACELGDTKKRASFRKRITRTLRFIFNHKPDAVLLELPGIQYGLGTMIAAAIAGVPLAAVYQLVREDMEVGPLTRVMLRLLRFRNQHLVAVSEYSREILARKSGMKRESILVIPNGADVERFSMTDAQRRSIRAEKRQELQCGNDEILIVSVGRLAPQKGHDLLIPAIPHIIQAYPQARFIWVGDGPLHKKLTSLLEQYHVENHVQMLGRRDDVPGLLAAADLFVHPTRFEGLPFSVVEAMAAGTPIVSTRASSIPEIITHGVSGLLCEVEDIQDLRETILYALAHPEEMNQMAGNARRRVEHFSETAMVEKTLALLGRIAGKTS